MNKERIHLTIEHLELHGVDTADREAVVAALHRELTRLLGQGGVPHHWHEGAIQPPRIRVQPGDAPDRIGIHTAQAIYRGAPND